MKPEEFKLAVDDLLEWQPKGTLSPNTSKPKFHHKDNMRLACKGTLLPCEDCGALVKNRVVHIYKYITKFGRDKDYWIEHCTECSKKWPKDQKKPRL